MKKVTLTLVLIMVITTILSTNIFAVEIPLRVVVNGERISFPDAQPFIDENGRTQVPVRFVSEALGADVGWDGSTRTVTVEQGRNKISLVVGKSEYTVNSKKMEMDTSVIIVEDRTFVPIRFVSEALGADVDWNASIRTVYITTGGTVATPSPEGGNVKYYDGIAFNDVTDVDEYGRMTVEKSQEFLLKMANQLSFVKENGRYYIVGEYPEIPEEFEWSLGIGINLISGGRRSFAPGTRLPGFDIPREGSFKKDTTGLIDIDNVRGIHITIAVRNKEINSHLGILEIGYLMEGTFNDGTTKRANFIPESAKNQRIPYSDIFNFKKMFQW
ncbi:copper amine oxidase N-terminal domain-containing protein [Acetivibrio saccincola]|uniref:Copper amine oxidase n=1 Tax=Acetivibrio saccincola TaxID=1677857 RepID=A0A2S8R6K4_9FIRM|nr:copper amine oxidase N-terminal domain-containing protein [Acetivibrio saccincola]PQQ65425.1 copper amine oxidase [Acetivibrio saccincola]